MTMEIIRPIRQKVWGWPAVFNFVFGGTAAGFYLLLTLATVFRGAELTGLKLLAPLLVAAGFLALTIEAGRPLRSHYLLSHLRNSWMSREAFVGPVFVVAAFLDGLLPHPSLWGVAVAAALGLLISQSYILYRSRAITAWNVWRVLLLFLTSSFATGGGLLLLSIVLGGLTPEQDLLAIGMICVTVDSAAWLFYLFRGDDPEFRRATKNLRGPFSLSVTLGIGRLLPLVLFLVALGGSGAALEATIRPIIAAAALAMITGGVVQKASLVLDGGCFRSIPLELQKKPYEADHWK